MRYRTFSTNYAPRKGPHMSYRIGVDIGGTFTDFALYTADSGTMAIHKQLTTPSDPSIAVLDGIKTLLDRSDVKMNSVEAIAHGTTLVTNSVIERRGAKTGMLVTGGFQAIPEARGFEVYVCAVRHSQESPVV